MARSRTVSVLVADVVSSTELFGRLGVDRADEARRALFGAFSTAIRAGQGELVKTMGDGCLATFPSAAEAVTAAVALQQGAARLAERTVPGLGLRVGVAVGDVTEEDGDVFGPAVVTASRLCAAAGEHQVLATPPPLRGRAVSEHMTERAIRPGDPLFPAPGGGTVRLSQWRRRFWSPAVARAGLTPLRPHDLRHTAVALWIAAGASPNEIAARAGHASVATVLDRYGHLLPGTEDKVNDALDALARGVRPNAEGAVMMLPTAADAES